MNNPTIFDPATHTIGLSRDLVASKVPARPDPPVPVDGVTIGVATMTENSPHGGEIHLDGDEILYLIYGRARIVFLEEPIEDIEMQPGDGLVVPKAMWHRVDILEPCKIVYVTPGPNNDFKPVASDI